MVVKSIKKGLGILSNPHKAFKELEKETLESSVAYYMKMLILMSIAAAIANFVYSFGRSVYLDIVFNTDIKYIRMLNYVVGSSTSLAFLYLFVGTFCLFLISGLCLIFVRKIRYTDILKIVFYSTTPILIFGWIPLIAGPLIIWSFFLFISGIRFYKTSSIKKNSIKQRY